MWLNFPHSRSSIVIIGSSQTCAACDQRLTETFCGSVLNCIKHDEIGGIDGVLLHRYIELYANILVM